MDNNSFLFNRLHRRRVILIALPVLAVFVLFLAVKTIGPNLAAGSRLREFQAKGERDFDYVALRTETTEKTVSDRKVIGGLLGILKADEHVFYKKAGLIPDISLECRFHSTSGGDYVFDFEKTKESREVHVFFRTERSSIYLSRWDENRVLDKLFQRGVLSLQE